MGETLAADAVRPISFETLSGGRPILVLAPHPDDESLGCGALLAQAFAGPGGHVICMTDGAASHPGSASYPPRRLAACRAAELDDAVAALGGGRRDVTRLGLPDAGMAADTVADGEIANAVAALARRLGAGAVAATAPTDPHCDHVATARIARMAARRAGLRLLYYPIWSRWSDPAFRTGLPTSREIRLDSAAMRDRKARAIAAHASQHGRLIDDDPNGFVLPKAFVAMFLDTDEIFFEARP